MRSSACAFETVYPLYNSVPLKETKPDPSKKTQKENLKHYKPNSPKYGLKILPIIYKLTATSGRTATTAYMKAFQAFILPISEIPFPP